MNDLFITIFVYFMGLIGVLFILNLVAFIVFDSESKIGKISSDIHEKFFVNFFWAFLAIAFLYLLLTGQTGGMRDGSSYGLMSNDLIFSL